MRYFEQYVGVTALSFIFYFISSYFDGYVSSGGATTCDSNQIVTFVAML